MTMNFAKKCVITLLILPLVISIVFSAVPVRLQIPDFNATHQIKFMTYNIHFGVGMDDHLNLERIVQNILVEDPDIIGLEEVENGRVTSQGLYMAQWIAKQLGMNFYYYPAVNQHAFGVALLSRYPILNITTYNLPTIIWERVMLRGTIQVNSTFLLDVFVTHLGLEDDNTTAQVEYIISQTNLVSRPKVLMGDFNLRDNMTQIGYVTSIGGFNDTAKDYNKTVPGNYYTFHSWPAPYERIDYIFASGFKAINRSTVVSDMNPSVNAAWEFGSDHLPLVTVLEY
ncbi:MAG: endonuclease/exonuclease/phosphatase family protein [Candidatus Helarchaeota archaeon]